MTKTLAPLTFAATIALGAGVALLPGAAAAQGSYDQGYDRPSNRSYGSDNNYDRMGRMQFERGYRQGRMEERERNMQSSRDNGMSMGRMGQENMPGSSSSQGNGGNSGGNRDAMLLLDPYGHAVLLVERGRQEQASQQAMQDMKDARTALQQGNSQQAQQALDHAERVLQQSNPSSQQRQQQQQQASQQLDDAEQALQRNDAQAARKAVQQARQALQSSNQGGSQSPQGSSSSNSGSSGQQSSNDGSSSQSGSSGSSSQSGPSKSQ